MTTEPQITVSDVVQALGGNKEVAALLGVGSSAVSNYKRDDRFPERVHLRIFRACQERQIDYDPAASTAPAA